jgi:hypothetical protein
LRKAFDSVARWFISRPKVLVWVYFGGPWNGKCWYIFWPLGIIYDNLYMYLQPFGVVCGPLVYIFRIGMFGPTKYLATPATQSL